MHFHVQECFTLVTTMNQCNSSECSTYPAAQCHVSTCAHKADNTLPLQEATLRWLPMVTQQAVSHDEGSSGCAQIPCTPLHSHHVTERCAPRGDRKAPITPLPEWQEVKRWEYNSFVTGQTEGSWFPWDNSSTSNTTS